MISRETFKDAINFIIRVSELDTAVHEIYRNYNDILIDGYGPFVDTSIIVRMLNESFKLPETEEYGSDLDYWLWECSYGVEWYEREPENTDLPENHRYRKPKINNLDELYDYLKWIHDSEETKELLGEINKVQ